MWDAAEAHGRDALLAARVKLVPMAADEVAKFKALVAPIVDETVTELDRTGKPAKAFVAAYGA